LDSAVTIYNRRSNGNAAEPVEQFHAAIFEKYPLFNHIVHFSSHAVVSVMKSAKKIPALIDDFAQMAGSDARVCGPRSTQRDIRYAAAALRGRNCVLVRGIGAVCCAANESDCAALLSLTEKNALVYVNALAYGPRGPSGTPKPLSFIDRKLLRFVYKRVYSKKEAIE
jgi:L-fuculose-phosphate aldolase